MNPLQDIITKDCTPYNISMIRYSIIASGRVQGVGFRAYVQDLARDMDITGWVRNLPDGTVECEAEGKEEVIEQFIQIIRNNSDQHIRVTNLDTRQISCTNELDFCIRR